jgi:hypothetical protein
VQPNADAKHDEAAQQPRFEQTSPGAAADYNSPA